MGLAPTFVWYGKINFSCKMMPIISFSGGTLCLNKFNIQPVPSADKATQRKSATPGGEARLAPICLPMSNAKAATRNITARQASPISATSSFILSFHLSLPSVFVAALLWLRRSCKINNWSSLERISIFNAGRRPSKGCPPFLLQNSTNRRR